MIKNKTCPIIILSLIVISTLCNGCKGKPQAAIDQKEYNFQLVLDELKRYGLHIKGNPTVTQITLPQEFNDANWGMKKTICEESGYSLSRHAGEKVFLISINIAEKYHNEPLTVWIITKKNTCIGAYVSVRKNSQLIPGIFSINEIGSKH
jgi:hypothetical protein